MASIEEEIKTTKFESEQMKANVNILFTSNWLYNHISNHLKKYKLTQEQFNVLRILKGSHPKMMNQKDILSRMIARNSNLTLIIKKLVAKKLIIVQQSEHDKREYQISITYDGIVLLDKISVERQQQNIQFNKLSVSEAFHLNSLLDKLRGD